MSEAFYFFDHFTAPKNKKPIFFTHPASVNAG